METKYDKILQFLYDNAKSVADNGFLNYLEKLQSPEILDVISPIIEKMPCQLDFHSWFKDKESISELMQMKSTNLEDFYTIVHYENVLLNVCNSIFGITNGVVLLNTDDLFKSYIIRINMK